MVLRRSTRSSVPSHRRLRTERSRKGAVLVELAIALPILLAVLGGTLDLCRFGYYFIALGHAVGSGARYATNHPFSGATQAWWQEKVRQVVRDEMSGVSNFNPTDFAMPAPTYSAAYSQNVKVVRLEASYTFRTVVSWPLLPNVMVARRVLLVPIVR
jgi:Flp pilus assembly protein TadG